MRPGDLLEQRYRLVRVLGRGRSGSVWCARNELIDRPVAVKVLHRSLAADPERLQRFFQEARACGRVRHPAVVEVLDLGQGDDGTLFLVMELLEGETMASLLSRKGRLSPDEALALVVPLAHGLAAAHTHGILHRDLKPANIYLHKTPTGGLQPKILDFGISKILGTDVTATGIVLGTPSYMSPEQARGVPDLDARTDVWSLGVILYECLTGRLPFIAKEYRALVDEIVDKKHVPVDRLVPDVPSDLARMVDECLEKGRERRMPSAATMAQKLTSVLRRRGRDDLVRDPDDEFSEGAPTLTADREKMKAIIDDTLGDAAKQPAAAPRSATGGAATGEETPHLTEKAAATIAPSKHDDKIRTALGIQPSAVTAFLASQTAGNKRQAGWSPPRPAAGTPAKVKVETKTDRPPSRASREDSAAKLATAVRDSEETHPEQQMPQDPDATQPPAAAAPRDAAPVRELPANAAPRGARVAAPAPAQGGSTHAWELAAAAAASGRAEVILGPSSPVAPATLSVRASEPKMVVDGDWDTTVADISPETMEKGPTPLQAAPLPKAPPTAPMVTDPPPAKTTRALQKSPSTQTGAETPVARKSIPPSASADGRLEVREGAPKKLGASLAAIPGFSAAGPHRDLEPRAKTAPPPAPVATTSKAGTSRPPPPRSAPPAAPRRSQPPPAPQTPIPAKVSAESVPKKTVPPRPPPPKSKSNTIRPTGDFAAPASPDVMQLSAPRMPADAAMLGAPLLGPELLALGDNPLADAFGSEPEPVFELGAPRRPEPIEEPPASDAGATISNEVTPDVVLETDRHSREAPSIAPLMLVAAAVLFVFGGIVGTFAASRRGTPQNVRRFAAQTGVVVAWHLQAEKVGAEEAKVAADKATAQKLKDQAAADAKKKADDEAKKKAEEDAAAAAAAASASASASASTSASAKVPPKPVPKPAAKPTPTPKPTPKPTAKPTGKPAPKEEPKKDGNKEWWQKKF